MYILFIVTGTLLGLSFFMDREKTLKAMKIALKKFLKIVPAFLSMLILISLLLFFVPDSKLALYLGNNGRISTMLFAVILGSIAFMPGFIAFPLCGILLQKGSPYMVLSAFSTTLMMVGIVSFPIEKKYFGGKISAIRNLIGMLTAIIVALVTGFLFGEIF